MTGAWKGRRRGLATALAGAALLTACPLANDFSDYSLAAGPAGGLGANGPDGGGGTGGVGAGGAGGSAAAGGGTSCVPPGLGGVCDTKPQCGCQVGENCYSDGSGITNCMKAGPGHAWSLCASTSQCGVGLVCASGQCRPYCAGPDENSSCSGRPCRIESSTPGVFVCMTPQPCDLVAPETVCPPGRSCAWQFPSPTTDCGDAGPAQRGEQCSGLFGCAPGLYCANDGICYEWCHVNSDCSVGTCNSFNPPLEIDTTEYKACG